jgi:hypothetical protein
MYTACGMAPVAKWGAWGCCNSLGLQLRSLTCNCNLKRCPSYNPSSNQTQVCDLGNTSVLQCPDASSSGSSKDSSGNNVPVAAIVVPIVLVLLLIAVVLAVLFHKGKQSRRYLQRYGDNLDTLSEMNFNPMFAGTRGHMMHHSHFMADEQWYTGLDENGITLGRGGLQSYGADAAGLQSYSVPGDGGEVYSVTPRADGGDGSHYYDVSFAGDADVNYGAVVAHYSDIDPAFISSAAYFDITPAVGVQYGHVAYGGDDSGQSYFVPLAESQDAVYGHVAYGGADSGKTYFVPLAESQDAVYDAAC